MYFSFKLQSIIKFCKIEISTVLDLVSTDLLNAKPGFLVIGLWLLV